MFLLNPIVLAVLTVLHPVYNDHQVVTRTLASFQRSCPEAAAYVDIIISHGRRMVLEHRLQPLPQTVNLTASGWYVSSAEQERLLLAIDTDYQAQTTLSPNGCFPLPPLRPGHDVNMATPSIIVSMYADQVRDRALAPALNPFRVTFGYFHPQHGVIHQVRYDTPPVPRAQLQAQVADALATHQGQNPTEDHHRYPRSTMNHSARRQGLRHQQRAARYRERVATNDYLQQRSPRPRREDPRTSEPSARTAAPPTSTGSRRTALSAATHPSSV
jgi:hypothetical protein